MIFDMTPTQIAQFSLTSQIGGMFSSAIGSYFSAESQKSSLKFQADMAEINARLSETSAQQELLKGERQVGALTLRAGQVKGAQRAAMAANGIDLGVGNAAEVLASTEILKEVDKNTASANAVQNAWGFRLQGTNYENDALIKRATASAVSPVASAASSLLGSAGSVAKSWYQFSKGAQPSTQSADPLGDFGAAKGWW